MKYKVGDRVRIYSATEHRSVYDGRVVTINSINPNGKTAYKPHIAHYGVKENIPFVFWEDELASVPVNTHKIVITFDGTETLARLYEGNKVVKTATAKCSPADTFDFKTGAGLAFERLMGEEPKEKRLKFEIGKQYKYDDLVIEITEAKKAAHDMRYYYKVIKGSDTGVKFFDENSFFAGKLKPYDLPKPFNGKVVCIKTAYPWWTVGKVYDVVNGKIFDDRGKQYPKRDGDYYKDAEDVRHAGDDGKERRHNVKNEFVPLVE